MDENIRNEYSTLTVEKIDKTNSVVDILKEYIPKDRFDSIRQRSNHL